MNKDNQNTQISDINVSNSSNSSNKSFIGLKDVSACGHIALKDRVKVLLQRLGRNQSWLSDQCNVTKGTISKVLAGYWAPTSSLKLNMAKTLEVDSLVLFGNKSYFYDYNNSYIKLRNSNSKVNPKKTFMCQKKDLPLLNKKIKKISEDSK
jgi:hypothetical protein